MLIFPNLRASKDFPIWNFTNSGLFTNNSSYHFIDRKKRHSNDHNQKNLLYIWKMQIHSKIKFFLWLLHHNILPTNLTLIRRGINTSPTCLICNQHEDISHIFFEYPITQDFWTVLLQKNLITSLSIKTFIPLTGPTHGTHTMT